MHGGVIKGGAKAPFDRGSKGPVAPRSFSAFLGFQHPQCVTSQVAEGVRYSFIPTLSHLDLCVVLQFREKCEAAKNIIGFPKHSDHYLEKGRGFMRV